LAWEQESRKIQQDFSKNSSSEEEAEEESVPLVDILELNDILWKEIFGVPRNVVDQPLNVDLLKERIGDRIFGSDYGRRQVAVRLRDVIGKVKLSRSAKKTDTILISRQGAFEVLVYLMQSVLKGMSLSSNNNKKD